MVNDGYLNRLNESLPLWRSADHEVRQIDGLDPLRLRVDRQRTDGERDAIGNSAVLGVQFKQPCLTRERVRKRPLPELKQEQRQDSAEQRGVDQIGQQVSEAEPECSRGCHFGVSTADPSKRK